LIDRQVEGLDAEESQHAKVEFDQAINDRGQEIFGFPVKHTECRVAINVFWKRFPKEAPRTKSQRVAV
jgi:hypothetical protein